MSLYPTSVALYDHLGETQRLWQSAQQQHSLPVSMPDALARKYANAPFEWSWQYLFPAANPSLDPLNGALKRHHYLDDTFGRALRKATAQTNVHKKVSPHTLPCAIRSPRICSKAAMTFAPCNLLGHKDIRTTRIYLHTMNRPGLGVRSPLDV